MFLLRGPRSVISKLLIYSVKIACVHFLFGIPVFSQPTVFSGSASSYPTSQSQIRQLEQSALGQGYTQQQIDAMKESYIEGRKGPYINKVVESSDDILGVNTGQVVFNPDTSPVEVNQQQTVVNDGKIPYFGYSIFKNVPDAFRPNAVGPVDPGYLVGPGDVLRLSVWGQVEFQYELTVNKEGKIFIPVVGQVFVTGVPFDSLQQKIKNLLSKHYSGLAAYPPRTFMDLSVAQLRPIRIFVMGEVLSPGGYTVSSYATAFNALYSMGGPLEKGSLRDIKVLRKGKEIATVDIYEYLLAGRCTTDVKLQNNDVIFVPRRGKTVAITGSVFRPAIYELKEKENLQNLLLFCGGIPASTNIDRALIYRILPFDQRVDSTTITRVVDLDLKKYLGFKEDFVLYDRDSIDVIPLRSEAFNIVKLSGAVSYPGIYQCENLTVKDLIFNYGKPLDNVAFTKRADIIRLNEDLVTTKITPIDLEKLRNDPGYNFALQPGDEVIVYEKEVEKFSDLQVTVEGEVRAPGTYPMSVNMTVVDALMRAGGFTREAYRRIVDVYRIDRSKSDSIAIVFRLNLPDTLDYTDERMRNFILEDRDKIIVRSDPDYVIDNYVKISGLVKYQGKYAIHKRGDKLSDLIIRAGGLLPDAFLEGASIVRNKKRLLVDFKKIIEEKRSKEDILLLKGDSIHIPPRPNTVYVHGNVNISGQLSYKENLRVKDYIKMAGGLADSSNFILVTGPAGYTKKVRKNGFSNPKVKEGSEIFVAKKLPKPEKERTGPSVTEVVRDTLAIITSAVTIIALVVRLKE